MYLIDKLNMEEIIEDLKYILAYDINFMNLEGDIVASTDVNRIGTSHSVAKKCIKQNKIITITYKDQNTDCRQGVNAPIIINNNIIGVIGITGNVNDVEKYILVIVKMVQRQIISQLDIELQNRIIKENAYFVDLVLSNKYSELISNDHQHFDSKYQIAVIKTMNQEKLLLQVIKKKVKCFIKIHEESKNIIVIANHIDIKQVIKLLKDDYVAIHSNIISNLTNCKKLLSFLDSTLINLEQNQLHDIDKVTFEVIVSNSLDTSDASLFKYIYELFPKEKLFELAPIVVDYYESNKSIQAVSKIYLMHPNTIKYKLNHVRDVTGLDYTNYKDSLIIYLAFKNVINMSLKT